MARYIDAEKLKAKLHVGDELREKFNTNPAVAQLISIEKDIVTEMEKHIDETPTEDVAPIVRGKWIETQKGIIVTDYKCSICGRMVRDDTGYNPSISYPYCHCGARMEEAEETE